MSERLDLEIAQGSDYRRVIPVLREDGQPRLLTGWSARGVIRPSPDGDLLYELPVTVSAGKITITVPGTDSLAWEFRQAVYEVVLIGPQRQRERRARGRVVVDPAYVHD